MSSLTIDEFWERCRESVSGLPETAPEAWAFGATPEQAERLLALVLSGRKTATAASLWDYEACAEALPQPGELHIVLDGNDAPQALIETTELTVIPFERVTDEHAFREGEGDRTRAYWRAAHEQFWREHSENPRGFEPGMPVVCEQFRLLFPIANTVDQLSSQSHDEAR